jgi:transcription elongation factor Elf1
MNCPFCGHHDHLEIDLHADGFSADLLECAECGAMLTTKGPWLETIQGPAKPFTALTV